MIRILSMSGRELMSTEVFNPSKLNFPPTGFATTGARPLMFTNQLVASVRQQTTSILRSRHLEKPSLIYLQWPIPLVSKRAFRHQWERELLAKSDQLSSRGPCDLGKTGASACSVGMASNRLCRFVSAAYPLSRNPGLGPWQSRSA